MKTLSIGYFADGPWSHKAFELIIKDPNINVKFIAPRKDTKDEVLRNFAESNGIDYLFPVNINSSDFISRAKEYDCDLFVSMSFNQIFKKEILLVPKLGVINCHAGSLPFYRGRNVLNWVLINDEKEFGITVHFVDEGIDTGDIIQQKKFPITDNDDYGTILALAHTECAKVLFETLKSIRDNNYSRRKQSEIHPVGFYCGGRTVGDEIINWNQTSRDIFNFVRAVSNPGPMATAFKNKQKITFNKSKMILDAPNYKGTNGQILSKTKSGYIVKTLDSTIEIYEINTDAKLSIGDVLEGK